MSVAALKRKIRLGLRDRGWVIHRVPKPAKAATAVTPAQDRIQYACGYNYLPGWLNVDIMGKGPEGYLYVNLVERHPFPDNHFRFAFCEDFIEHIEQADSLVFLEEVHRTMRPGGVFRVTFPCLEEVLKKHFTRADFDTYAAMRTLCYPGFGHLHYYSRESLAVVARHIGFDVKFVEKDESAHPELRGLNARSEGVNLHSELTKR